MSLVRLRFDDQDFGKLVRGEPVRLKDFYDLSIELVLDGVSFERMYFHIERAMRDKQARDGTL